MAIFYFVFHLVFQLENFKLYFPFVLGYDTALKIITNINPDELSSLLPLGSKSSESDMIQGYTAPYHRIEIYCSLFQVSSINV